MKTFRMFLGLLILSIMWPSNVLTADFNQVVSSGTTENLFGICMTSDLIGYAVGGNGEIVVTNDGGNNWTHMPTGFFTTLRAITFANANTGYAVGLGGLVLKTTNAGLNWTSSAPTSYDLFGLSFSDVNTGYIVGDFATAYKTTNGGINWVWLNTGLINDEILTSVVGTANKVFIGVALASTNLIVSTNGGNTWSSNKTRTSGDLRTLGMAVSGNTICLTGN